MTVYGYARVSTPKQRLQRQIDAIHAEYPTVYIYMDEWTGTDMKRPEWGKLLKVVKPGDTIVFDSVSRMSRNAKEGVTTYQDFYNKGVELVFLKEPSINTAVYRENCKRRIELEVNSGEKFTDTVMQAMQTMINDVLLAVAAHQVELAFAQSEKEVADLRERTRGGIAVARAAGKQIGRASGTTIETEKAKIAKRIIKKHSKAFGGSLKDIDVIKLIKAECGGKLDRKTYYKYKAELLGK